MPINKFFLYCPIKSFHTGIHFRTFRVVAEVNDIFIFYILPEMIFKL